MKTLAVIPARYASTRFPGKPLVSIRGKSMIRRTYEQATKADSVDRVIVATDDQRIVEHVRGFGGDACLTDPAHPSGTDRVAEVAAAAGSEFPFIVNVQGDEPFIQPAMIDQVLAPLRRGSTIGTLAKEIVSAAELHNPNVVKVVRDRRGKALFFSRYPIPFWRGQPTTPDSRELPPLTYFKHIGIYAFRAGALADLAQLAPTPLEEAESLEQLRWLESGYAIQVEITEMESHGIDTPEDLQRFT